MFGYTHKAEEHEALGLDKNVLMWVAQTETKTENVAMKIGKP